MTTRRYLFIMGVGWLVLCSAAFFSGDVERERYYGLLSAIFLVGYWVKGPQP